MINEYDRVKIIETGDVGIVVDIRETNGTFVLLNETVTMNYSTALKANWKNYES